MGFCGIVLSGWSIYFDRESWFRPKKYTSGSSVAPFGISLVVAIIAGFATFKGADLFFSIDKDKIEYKFGMIKPVTHSFQWIDIKELVMPAKQKKIKLVFKDGSSFVINLNWIQRKKSIHIRRHIFHVAREKDLNVIKVATLAGQG